MHPSRIFPEYDLSDCRRISSHIYHIIPARRRFAFFRFTHQVKSRSNGLGFPAKHAQHRHSDKTYLDFYSTISPRFHNAPPPLISSHTTPINFKLIFHPSLLAHAFTIHFLTHSLDPVTLQAARAAP